jgi:hypothetical protein
MNKTVDWIIQNKPKPKTVGRFYSYQYVFSQAYGFNDDANAGRRVKEDIKPFVKELYSNHKISIQAGVHHQGFRGIRIWSVD